MTGQRAQIPTVIMSASHIRHFLSRWLSSQFLSPPRSGAPRLCAYPEIQAGRLLEAWLQGGGLENSPLESPVSMPSGVSGLVRFPRKEPFKLPHPPPPRKEGQSPGAAEEKAEGSGAFYPKSHFLVSHLGLPGPPSLDALLQSFSETAHRASVGLRNHPFILRQTFRSPPLVPVPSRGGVFPS